MVEPGDAKEEERRESTELASLGSASNSHIGRLRKQTLFTQEVVVSPGHNRSSAFPEESLEVICAHFPQACIRSRMRS